jgi:hypothetical protein
MSREKRGQIRLLFSRQRKIKSDRTDVTAVDKAHHINAVTRFNHN